MNRTPEEWGILLSNLDDVTSRYIEERFEEAIEDIYEQAARITTLEAENKRMREAVEEFSNHFGPMEDNHMLADEVRNVFRIARTALQQKEG